MKYQTWGERWHRYLRQDYDHGYAAYLADNYVRRQSREIRKELASRVSVREQTGI